MMQALIALAWGIGTFAIIVGMTSVVLDKFGNAVGGTSNTTVQYLLTQLGSTGGGLSTYAPIIIVVGVAFVIFAAFGVKSKKY